MLTDAAAGEVVPAVMEDQQIQSSNHHPPMEDGAMDKGHLSYQEEGLGTFIVLQRM